MTRRRSGFVLMEVVLALTALAIMFAVAVGLLHVLMKLDRIGREHLAAAGTRERLSRQFRADVRAAATAAPEASRTAPSPRLVLTLSGGRTVEYTTEAGRVVRAERDRDASVRTETFRFPSSSSARFAVEAGAEGRFASVIFRRRGSERVDGGAGDLECSALMGKDSRRAATRSGEVHDDSR